MTSILWLTPLGVLVGALGTLIGSGGGFLLVPLLLFLYPADGADTITGISLATVFVNAAAGSIAYARMWRIDYPSGLLFAAASLPGAVLGAFATRYVSRWVFDPVFGGLMVVAALVLLAGGPSRAAATAGDAAGRWRRVVVERDGTIHAFAYNPRLGAALSALVGVVSSLLGIGGGVMHVPILSRLLRFPVHVATATSQFALAGMALAGTLVHVLTGGFRDGLARTVALAAGVLVGAPAGAWLSTRLPGAWILRSLAVALAVVGGRLLARAW